MKPQTYTVRQKMFSNFRRISLSPIHFSEPGSWAHIGVRKESETAHRLFPEQCLQLVVKEALSHYRHAGQQASDRSLPRAFSHTAAVFTHVLRHVHSSANVSRSFCCSLLAQSFSNKNPLSRGVTSNYTARLLLVSFLQQLDETQAHFSVTCVSFTLSSPEFQGL